MPHRLCPPPCFPPFPGLQNSPTPRINQRSRLPKPILVLLPVTKVRISPGADCCSEDRAVGSPEGVALHLSNAHPGGPPRPCVGAPEGQALPFSQTDSHLTIQCRDHLRDPEAKCLLRDGDPQNLKPWPGGCPWEWGGVGMWAQET